MPDKSKMDDFIDRTDRHLEAIDGKIFRLSLILGMLAVLIILTNEKARQLMEIATAFAGGR